MCRSHVSVIMAMLVLVLCATVAFAQSFTEIPMPGAPSGDGFVIWGDYDNDGDLDILFCGLTASGPRTGFYRNDAGVFAFDDPGFYQIFDGVATWAPWHYDDDLAVWLTGAGATEDLSNFYINYGSGYMEHDYIANPLHSAAADVGDYNNDGYEDFIYCGGRTYSSNVSPSTVLLQGTCDDGLIYTSTYGLPGLYGGDMAWGDYDNDGDLDLLFAGADYDAVPQTQIHENDGGFFSDAGAGLPGLLDASVDWGDYDADGDLDILLTGSEIDGTRHADIFRNDDGVFTDIAAGLPGVSEGCGRWGDIDNDGDLDVLLTGQSDSGEISRIYRYGASVFTDVMAGLPGLTQSDAAWSDYDADGDLDFVLQGYDSGTGAYVTSVYRSAGASPNTLPSAPTNLTATVTYAGVVLSWDASSDAETPTAGLSYDLRIGTSPGGNEISKPDADATGWRKIARPGHTIGTAFPFAADHDTYYWSVQAIDGALAGSAFSAEGSFSTPFEITSIRDCHYDAGGNLSLTFSRCFNDRQGYDREIEFYTVKRQVDATLWDYIATIPARGDSTYSLIVPTLCDSSATGNCPATFKVMAHQSWGDAFETEPASGYSTVELMPGPPSKAGRLVTQPLEICEPDRSLPPLKAHVNAPTIVSVTDIPDDDGGQVRLTWSRSSIDPSGYPDRGVAYQIHAVYWSCEVFKWQYLGEVPADGSDLYAAIVPTLIDNDPWGPAYTEFVVSVMTQTRTRYFKSDTKYGWSVDNLAPQPPVNLAVDYQTGAGNALSWTSPAESDYSYTNIYCDTAPDFMPSAGTLCAQTAANGWQDPNNDGPAWYYQVAHVDFAGNESLIATGENLAGVDLAPSTLRFALQPCRPNPFNPKTEIRFSLARSGPVSLRVYDVSGRLVRTLVDGEQLEAGEYVRSWSGRDSIERAVAAGVYFYRLQSGDEVQTRAMTLVK